MKIKTNNKMLIMLSAIILLLLVFSATFNMIGQTNSWLKDDDDIGFVLNVQAINLVVKQGEREITDSYIYLGTDLIEGDTEYVLNVTITNNEIGKGYYIRSQAFAVVNGVTYNINNYIVSDLKADGKWLYSVDSNNNKVAMAPSGEDGSVLNLITSVTFPQEFINAVQGQYIKLHLFVEGSATGTFDSIVK